MTRSERRRTAGIAAALSLACTVAVSACAGGTGRDEPPSLQLGPVVVELASPAGRGSVEPYVAPALDGSVLLSWLEATDSTVELRFARRTGDAWAAPAVIASSSRFFVNWADFPSIVELSDGRLMAHWLGLRGGRARGAYDVWTAFSRDGGATWTEPARPHADSVPMPHGFVSLFEIAGEPAAVWLFERPLDGATAAGHGAGVETRLQFTTFDAGGAPRPDGIIDARACDCCQTDAAATDDGPVVVYRDRTENEIRDIVAVRYSNGAWTEPRVVHEDGWRIDGCPVNGPAIAATGRAAAVAWFTAPEGEDAKVLLAFSDDAADSFAAPVRIDEGNPVGRVDVVMLDSGVAAVSWLERSPEGAAVSVRTVTRDGGLGEVVRVGSTSDGRPSGFPRIARNRAGGIVVAWTVPGDGGGVRVAEIAAGPSR